MSDFKIYIDFTKIAEGGLSKAKTDTASKYPVPDGSGYHTNKGITWTTFKRLSNQLGYKATPELFYEMPDGVFYDIFRHYWINSGAYYITNQAIANLIFQSAWGGGNKPLVRHLQRFLSKNDDGIIGPKTAKAVNTYPDQKNLYIFLHNKRLSYLRSLRSYEANGRGWERRMKKLYKFNMEFL